jgi:hypothetical protein
MASFTAWWSTTLSAEALLTPASTAATISSSRRETVRARVTSSEMSSFWAHQS